jgi:hypothetical protein
MGIRQYGYRTEYINKSMAIQHHAKIKLWLFGIIQK